MRRDAGSQQAACRRGVGPRVLAPTALALAFALSTSLPAGAQTADPAQAIAGQFAADTDRAAARAKAAEHAARQAEARREVAQRKAEDARRKAAEAKRAAGERKADEAEMLARARAEGDARRVEEQRLRVERERAETAGVAARAAADAERATADAAARAASEVAAADAKRKAEDAEDEARRRAAFAEKARQEEVRIDRERATAQARSDADRRAAKEAAAAAERAAEEETKAARVAEDRLVEEATLADAARQTMEAEREAENRNLLETLERIEAVNAADRAPKVMPETEIQSGMVSTARATPPVPPPPAALLQPTGATPNKALASPAAADATAPVARVTILLSMKPGDRGIRRYNKTADPVLCLGDACYVSKGPDSDAWRAPRMRALGSLNTLGGRADACNQSLTCVYRNVDLGGVRAAVQPIDLRVLRHDRRGVTEVAADPTCVASESRIDCSGGVDGGDYRLWVVPEPVARKAGPAALQAALAAGLVSGKRAAVAPR